MINTYKGAALLFMSTILVGCASEAAELVKLGRMTKGQDYSHIVKVRSVVNAEIDAAYARDAAAYSSGNGNIAQPKLDSMNKLLESNQNSGLTSDY